MDTSASIMKTIVPAAAKTLLGDGNGTAGRLFAIDASAAQTTGSAIAEILGKVPELRKTLGRWPAILIVVIAMLAIGRGRGRMLLGVSIGVLATLKYLWLI